MEENKRSKYELAGIIGTIVFHGAIIVLLLVFAFRTPLPLPAEEGVVVNLGSYDQGMGPVQPKQPAQSAASQSASSSSPDQTENVVTQNTDQAPVIDNSTKPNQNTQQNTTSDNQTEEPQENPVDENLLFPGNRQTDGGTEGETGEPGDQGRPDGSRNSDNYSGTPGGGGKDGVNYTLNGRTAISLYKPDNNTQEQGKVVVKIWVDTKGNVKRAKPGVKGSTTNDSRLYRIAKNAAIKTKFSKKNDAPEVQTGTITYIFIQSQ